MSSSIMALGGNPRQSRGLLAAHRRPAQRGGFTLVEMLIAMAITLVMIGAVVTLFANISNSVRNRRAVIEMSGQLRHARNMLQQDLQGATCNGLVWQRPDENQGYIEIIEGPQREGQASMLVDGRPANNNPGQNYNPEIDHKTSLLPASNLPFTDEPAQKDWLTDGGSLGDSDDILMLTVRNEHEPFVGRAPKSDGTPEAVRRLLSELVAPFPEWEPTTIESPLAEVVWFAVENPDEDNNANGFFGEPGMRTIYRRALLIAPWLNPYRTIASDGTVNDTFRLQGDSAVFTAQPGLLRVLRDDVAPADVAEAIASLIAFQERFDISARLEFDPLLGGSAGRWKIVANTLGDLTKRENRYEHHFYRPVASAPRVVGREFPFAVASTGSEYSGGNVFVSVDPEIVTMSPFRAGTANLVNGVGVNDLVSSYLVDPALENDVTRHLPVRPLAYINAGSTTVATARVMLNDDGEIIRILPGLVPLSGQRKGEDVMLTDALGFDLRVYDPGAPLFAHAETETVLEPTDPAWTTAYLHSDNTNGTVSDIGGANADDNPDFPFVGQGAYVDLGYGFDARLPNLLPPRLAQLPTPQFDQVFASATVPWFFNARAVSDVYGDQLAPGYAAFDTWSFHYENDGFNEDRYRLLGSTWDDYDALIDEGTNGLDDPGSYSDGAGLTRLGPDDVGERETVPPYDKPLRGAQVVLRLYERDSRQVRQVSVNQSFVPE